jgi:hypothetical protein
MPGDGVRLGAQASSSAAPSADTSPSLPPKRLARSHGAAGDVDVFADQVAVDARQEVIGAEVDVSFWH